MEKKIIAIAGDEQAGKTTMAEILEANGYYRISIDDKVIELTASLDDSTQENSPIKDVRKARSIGYNISRQYWINQILSSLPKDKTAIVIEDVFDEDLVDGILTPFFVTRDKKAIPVKGYRMIRNLSDLESFKSLIDNIFPKLIG